MKRILPAFLLAALLFVAAAAPAQALTINAKAAILIDASTGRVIFQQEGHTPLPPASTTKILTALLVLEQVEDLQTSITVPADFVNVGESNIYLSAGETFTYQDMLCALLLRSANDAAQVLASGVSGSEEAFVQLMNTRTAELGLTDSSWANPHGLDAENHLVSAYDLAMITRQALTHEMFNTIITTESYSLERPNAEPSVNVLYNRNQFLSRYQGADGVKTGYTSLAGSCLVASATQNGLRLIGVILNGEDHYAEMEKLMDYGFGKYEAVTVGKKGDVVGQVRVINGRQETVDVLLGADIIIPVEQGSDFSPTPVYDYPLAMEAPFGFEEAIGSVAYADNLGNTTLTPLYLAQGVERYTFGLVLAQAWQSFLAFLL